MEGTGRQQILLESGTNEMEIMEFFLGSQSFGINVHKLREIVPYDEERVTVLPDPPPSVLGLFMIRGNTVKLIDLGRHLNRRKDAAAPPTLRKVVLVCEFNGRVNSFLVDGVNQIHRVNWKDVNPLSHLFEKYRPRFTGSIHVENREVLIVDLEHIIAEIDPEMEMMYDVPEERSAAVESDLVERRGKFHLMVAEDSSLIRTGILKVLADSGYSHVSSFVDGEECFRAIRELHGKAAASGRPFSSHLNLLITDIEMPQMDGLTLCRRIREELKLDLPILVFSSLINEQMILKCRSVGADGCISKPQIPALVELVDGFCLKR